MLETDTSLQPKSMCHVSFDICVIWVDDETDETQPQMDLKSGFEKSWCGKDGLTSFRMFWA